MSEIFDLKSQLADASDVVDLASQLAEPLPSRNRTWGEFGKDVALSAVQGLDTLAKLPAMAYDKATTGDWYGPETKKISAMSDEREKLKSAESQAKNKDKAAKAQAAGEAAREYVGDGALGTAAQVATEFGTSFWESLKDPASIPEFVAQQAAQLGVMGKVGKGAEIAAHTAAKAAPRLAATKAGQAALAKSGTAGAVGFGAGLQGVDVGSDTMQRLMALPDDLWAQNPEYVALAEKIGAAAAKQEISAQLAGEATLKAGAVSLATAAMPGGTSIERALIGKHKGGYKAVPKAFAGEAGQEGAEEGSGKYFGNTAVQEINPQQDSFEGVGAAAGQGAYMGGVMGGGLHAGRVFMDNRRTPATQDVTPDGRLDTTGQEAGNPTPQDRQIDATMNAAAQQPAQQGEAREVELWAKASDGTITPEERAELSALQQAASGQPPVEPPTGAAPMQEEQQAQDVATAAPPLAETPPVAAEPLPPPKHPTEQAADAVVAQLAQEAGIPIEIVLPTPSTTQQATPLPETGAPQPVLESAPQPGGGADAFAQLPDALAQQGEIPSMTAPVVEVPAPPRTEKEARALRAKSQEISNANQAAETPLPAVQEEARQEPSLPAEQVAPKTEREAREQRRKTDILTPDGKKVAAQWDVVEADSIKASLKEGVSQPRDRTRAASNAQVLEIANNPDFERLSDTSKTMDYGAPTLSADGLIVGGNGRFEGVSRAYDGPTATTYRQAVEQQAARFGLDADAIKGMKKPVLVRRITDNADTRQLAIQSNQAAGLQMSDMEQAALDAERMKSLDQIEVSDTGDIPLTSRNMQAIQQTLGGYATNELAGMMTADGGLSQSGMRRLRNAILFSAYGKSDTLARLIESPDADMKNVGTALVRAAGKLAKVRGGVADGSIPADFDIAGDLTASIETLSSLRAEGKRLDEFLAQGDMFGGGLSASERAIITFLADNLRSAKTITEGLAGYAERVLSTQNSNGGLFGDAPLPTKTEVLNDATKRFADERAAAQSQQSIFDQPAPELHAAATGSNREVQAGESGNRPDTRGQSGDEAARKPESRTGTDTGNAKPAGVTHADDFALRPVEITEHLISTGNIKALYKAAGVKTADAFGDLPLEQRSKAYAKYVADGGKPAPAATEAYNDKVARQEREALIRRLQSDATVRQANGKPFKTEASAKEFSTRHELDDTHDAVKVEAGYVLKRLPEARRPSVLKAMAERQANDPENQRQERAFARAARIGAAASDAVTAYENGDTSIEQFEAALDAAEKVGAGDTAANEAVTQADAIAPEQVDVELLPTTPAQAAQAKTQESKIGDMGRKVIVRKDTATATGPRSKTASTDERPAWIRKYHVMQNKDGKWEIMEDVGSGRRKGMVKRVSYNRYATEQEAWDALPLVVAAKRHRAYSYTDKAGKQQYGIFRSITDRKRAMVKGGFATANEAMEYIAAHPVEIIEHKFPFPERPWLDKIERTGKDYRNGKDVTKQMFEDTFAPGAVVYGNWLLNGDGTVNADGQELSNFIYDALHDLADSIGVPPKALFLNGELALGIGADGKGGKNSAAAHYDPNPDKVLINLTKIKGAGSAAHEWWHAVDHYFARQGGYKDSSSVVAGDFPHNSKARPELVAAIKHVVDTMMHSTKSQTTDADVVKERAQKRVDDAIKNLDYYARDLRSTLKEGRYNKGKKVATEAQLQQWDAMVERLKAGDMGEKVYIDNPSKMRGALGFETGTVLRDMNALYKTVTGRSFLRQDPESTGRRMHWVVQSIKENLERTTAEQDETRTYKGRTDYYLEAKQIDNYRTGDYWSMPEELGARAFESYIFDKLTGTGNRSDYLVYAVENRHYAALGMKPYPEGAERKAINAAFDKLFETVQTKETDTGVAMFSRSAPDANMGDVAGVVDERTADGITAASSGRLSSGSNTAGAGLTIEQVEATYQQVTDGLKNAPLGKVVQSTADLPFDAPADVKGVFWKGSVYLVADNLGPVVRQGETISPVQVIRETIAHEMIGHYGLRGFFGATLDAVLNRIHASNPRVQMLAYKWKQANLDLIAEWKAKYGMTDAQVKARSIEEALAGMAEKGEKLNGWNSLAATLQTLLRKMGATKWADSLEAKTDAEALLALKQAEMFVKRGLTQASKIPDAAYPLFVRASNQPPLGLTGGKSTSPQPALPDETQARKVQRRVQDKLNRFTVIKDWLTEQGVKLSELADVYKAEERMHSRFANKADDFREKRVKPLVEKIQKAGFDMDDVAQFLHAQHAEERNAQVAKVNQDRPDAGSGMATAEARAILAKADPELKKLANEFRAIADDTLAILVNSGMVSKDQAAAYRAAYQHYVPLKGGPDDGKPTGTGKGLSTRHKIKRALGHELREGGEWIVENMLADHERAIMLSEKNRVGIHLLNMAVEAGRDDLLTIDKPKKRQVLKENVAYEVLHKGQVIGTFDSQEAARLFKGQAQGLYKSSTPSHFSIRRTSDPAVILMASPMPADNEAIVYVHGHEIRVQINDELLARAYKNMGAEALGTVMRVGAGLNAYFSRIYTGYNPEFIVTNIVRDFTTGLANLTGEEGIGMAGKAAKNYAARFIELFRYAATGKETQWVKMYREDGGNTGAAYLSDLERLGKEIQTEYAAYRGVSANLKAGDYKNAARAAGRKVFDKSIVWIERLNQAGENAMRLAVYQAMIESGRSRNEAASAAKNVTVNFNRKGELGQQANALFLFFNAGVQGTAAIAHAHTKGKHRGQAWAFSSTLMGLGYLLSLAAASGGDGADDEYEKVSEYERSRNLLIKTGDGYTKIPLPYGYGFFWNMGRGMADAQRTGEVGKMPWHVAASFVEEFTPFGSMVAGKSPDAAQAFLYAMPTMAQIAGAPLLNKSSMGGPMMPDNKYDEHQPDREKMNRATRGTLADDVAGAMESAGLDVSPETVNHLYRTFTGGAGSFAKATADLAILKGAGAGVEAKEIPFLRKFYTVPDVRGARARYYEAKDEADKTMSELNRARKAMDDGKVGQIVDEQYEMLRMAKLAEGWSKMTKAQRDRADSIRLSGTYTKTEERAIIKQMEREEAEMYDDFMAQFKTAKREMREHAERREAVAQ